MKCSKLGAFVFDGTFFVWIDALLYIQHKYLDFAKNRKYFSSNKQNTETKRWIFDFSASFL
jgi:hypothetical protein